MRIYQLLQQLIKQFVPIEPTTESELAGESSVAYGRIRDELRLILERNEKKLREAKEGETPDLEELQLKHKIVKILELWWVRYLLCIVFIIIVPFIKKWINNVNLNDEDEDEDEDEDTFAELMAYRRFKKQMKNV